MNTETASIQSVRTDFASDKVSEFGGEGKPKVVFIKFHILLEAGGGREITRILEHSICGKRGVLGGGN